MKNLFNLILTDKIIIDYNTMNINIYSCLKKMFDAVNMKEGNLEITDTLRIYKYDQLLGFKFFWTILIKCNNEEVFYNFLLIRYKNFYYRFKRLAKLI